MLYTRSSTTYFNSLLLVTKSKSAKELFDYNKKETTLKLIVSLVNPVQPGFG